MSGPRRLGWAQAIPWDIQNRLRMPPAKGQGNSVAERSQIVRSYAPPNTQKIPQSIDFNVDDYSMVLAIGPNTVVSSTTLNIELPQGTVGWLQGASFYILAQTALTSVRFDIRINGGVIPGFSYRNPPGVANLFLKEIGDIAVRIPNGGIVDILITNLNANGPWTVGGQLSGWSHSQAAEDQIFGESGY